MTKFIKLGTFYVRPDDIVHFFPNSVSSEKTTMKFKDGTEWNVAMKADAIAALLNETQP